ncbi:MAG: MoxR family ATPase [Thermoprotei archaeon]
MSHKEFAESLTHSLSRLIVGKEEVIRMVCYTLLVGGHVLFEDNPGLGKTTLAKGFAAALGCEFRRVQFTADLLPADITGTFVLDGVGGFRFVKGPVFTQILLADEINRSPPKTQSALLEAMQERQVSVENNTFVLPSPFMVLGTQNPIEYEGTYPLPEAQLDRFTVRLRMGYPTEEEELGILDLKEKVGDSMESVEKVATPEVVTGLQSTVDSVYAHPDIKRYVVRLAATTRASKGVDVGVSPRGTIHLLRMSKARAACLGRDYITPEDVKSVAIPVLAHRLILSPEYSIRGVTQEEVVESVLKSVPVPKVD